MNIYRAANGARFGDEAAQIAGKEFEMMTAEGLPIKPETVVDRARPEENPIHPYFTWDDPVAAEKWRKQEARHLIGHIVLVEKRNDEETAEKAFFSIKMDEEIPEHEEERHYLRVSEVKSDEDALSQVTERAISELRAWARRYETFLGQGTPLDSYLPVFEFVNSRMK